MNPVVMQLTVRGLLGRRRSLLLVILPALLLGLAALTRWGSHAAPGASAGLAPWLRRLGRAPSPALRPFWSKIASWCRVGSQMKVPQPRLFGTS